VIYIKAGAYMENVEVGKNQKNLMFIGDGIGKTVIKASRNVVDGSTTFRSATVGKLVKPLHRPLNIKCCLLHSLGY
jgi:pectinesterase